MKYKILIFISVILFSSQVSLSQVNKDFQFSSEDLIGIWSQKLNLKTKEISYEKRTTDKTQNYGLRIQLLENGEYKSRYSAKCGNDRSQEKLNNNGRWTLKNDELTIVISSPESRKGMVIKKRVKKQSDKITLVQITTN
ncbi:hypothetical protein [Winogradskyella jejuensis]|uniref:Lipocalin-like domain-containing protein n=1 Tax=Winogradskyella jejuensis TaxID=1089305 RepID=A0A1M5NXA1_9FLAO|nr:hypothetical protein [Winogradskyella jejuensis]SHG93789.1 hypothetical protein SAMN05444148_1313 [Winogradskyella jejuensis]